MIELYYWPTPNGHKITLFLEETGLDYRIHPVDISAGDQFKPEFLAFSPNNRMPAIHRHRARRWRRGDHGVRVRRHPGVSGREDRPFSSPPTRAAARRRWMAVLADGRFSARWPGRIITSASMRPRKFRTPFRAMSTRRNRLYGVLNRRLDGRSFIVGDAYSIADMACYPWVVPWQRQQQDLDAFPNLRRWFDAVHDRPATIRAYAKGAPVSNSRPAVTEEGQKNPVRPDSGQRRRDHGQ